MRRVLPVLLLPLLAASVASADILVVGGKPVRGTWWEDGDEIVVNPFNARNRAMTWNVERYPKSKVKLDKIRSTTPPEEEWALRFFDLRAAGTEEVRELALWAREQELEDLEARTWERVLELEPAHEEARDALGRKGLKAVLARNGRANPDLGDLMRRYLEAESGATRRVLYERMERDHDVAWPPEALERAWRSARQPKGRTDDIPLTFRADRVKGPEGVRYTLFVPSTYDPLVPTPLCIGLHGGGRGGADGKKVVGSGPSAMNFFQGLAEEHGWVVACPTAIEAPWSARPNEEFLDALLIELQFQFHVDLNRVYLAGHSMGGFGSWYWGPKWADRWAAFAPAAGGGGPSVGELEKTKTPVFVFHGADDAVVGPGSDRSAAKALRGSQVDFVYLELNGVGHGWPDEVRREMFRFLEGKRLARGRGRSFKRDDSVRSSWTEKLDRRLLKEEAHYLGAPEPPEDDDKEKPKEVRKRLLADLDVGGGKALEAAAAIAATKDEEFVKPLAKRLALAGRVADDVRLAAANALGGLGLPACREPLERSLPQENDPLFHAVLDALVALGDTASGPALLGALEFQTKQFDDKRIGDGMGYPDYEPRCAALGAVTDAVADLAGGRDAARRIGATVVARVFENAPRVPGLARAGHFPERVKEALGKRVAAALGRTGHADAAPVLERLAAACPDLPAIEAACAEARAALDGAVE